MEIEWRVTKRRYTPEERLTREVEYRDDDEEGALDSDAGPCEIEEPLVLTVKMRLMLHKTQVY